MNEIGQFFVDHWEAILGVLLMLLATDGIAGYLPDKWVPYIGAVKRIAQILLTRFGKGVPIILAMLMLGGCAGLKMEETAAPMAIPPPPGLSGDGARGIRVEGAVAMATTRLTQYTVATLPATPTEGDRAEVVDGASPTDCTVGSGTDIVTCRWNGAAWANVGDGQAAGSAEVQNEAFSAAHFNGDVTHAPTQDVFYDFWHLIDTDDDGVITDSELSIAGLTLTGANGLALGVAGSVQGTIRWYSNTPGNNYHFDFYGSNFTENFGWRIPTGYPAGANYLLNVDADGTMGYTDPASLGGGSTDPDALDGDTVDDNLIDIGIVAGITAFGESLLDDDNATEARSTLGAQEADADLTELAGLSCSEGQIPKQSAGGAWECAADANSGSATALNDIGDSSADGSVAQAGYKLALTSTLNSAGAIWTFTNTTADLTADVSFIDFKYTDDGDANGYFMRGYDNTGDLVWSIGPDGELSVKKVTSLAPDRYHYLEATNSDTILETATLGRLAFYNGEWRFANGTNWTSDYLLRYAALGSGVFTFLGTPSSANFFSAISDEGAYAPTLFATTSEADFKQDVNLEIGVDVQGYDAELTAWGGISPTTGDHETTGYLGGRTKAVSIGNCEGAHDGTGNAATLTDSGESLTVDAYIGMQLYNITDGSSCTITDNDATTITCTLAGGSENDWDAADVWQVGPGPAQSGSVFYISAATTIAHPATAGYVAGYFAAAAVVVKIDPYSASMTINFSDDGVYTDPGAGDEIDGDGTQGDFIWIHNASTTEAYSQGVNGSWADGGAS